MKIVDRLTKRRAGLSWHSPFPELDTRGDLFGIEEIVLEEQLGLLVLESP